MKGGRGRDIAWTAGLAVLVPAGLAVSGALTPITAGAGAFAILCLAAIYYFAAAREDFAADGDADGGAAAGALAAPAAMAGGGVTDVASAMIERLPDPVLLIGPGGRIDLANAAARGFLGLPSSLPRGGANITAVLRQPEVLEAVTAALRGEAPGPVEYRTHAPLEGFVKVSAAPLPGADGAAIMLLHDETDARRAEQMRAQFLANASHELRTPLASLAGFIETLRGHARDDPAARDRFLGIMQGQTDRMRRLINDLLSLSRIEMNEHLPPSGEVDLAVVAQDVADALKPIAKARGAEIRIEGPGSGSGSGAVVIGDRDQLTAVAQNLVDNALKYSPQGGVVRVEITGGLSPADAIRAGAPRGAARAETPGRFTIVAPAADTTMACLRVSDQGPGIDRSHLPRLAQRFYRVEEGKAEDRKGTGLGLAIVKHVMARHRGGFAVESEPGRGSSFIICAPQIVRAAAAPSARPAAGRS